MAPPGGLLSGLNALRRRLRMPGATPARLRAIGMALAALTILQGVLHVWVSDNAALEAATAEIANLDQALAEEVERHLQAIDLVTRHIQSEVAASGLPSQNTVHAGSAASSVPAYLAGLQSMLPQRHAVALFDADGQFLAGSQPDRRSKPIADHAYFTHLRDDPDAGLTITAVDSAPDTGQPAIVFARRLSDREGGFLGVVLGVMEKSYAYDFYAALNQRRATRVTWLRPSGEVLLHYPPDPVGPRVMPARSPWHDVVAARGGTYHSPGFWTGRPMIVAVSELRHYPLVVDVAVHESDILATTNTGDRLVLPAALVLSVLIGALFWILAAQTRRREEQNRALRETGDALRASETRLRDFAEMASDWFWEQDADLRLQWFSVASPSLKLHDTVRLGERRWEYIDTSGDPEKWEAHRQDLQARRPFFDFRYDQTVTCGGVRHFSISGRPIYDEMGTFQGYRGIGRNITAQIEMEQERDHARRQAERAGALLRDALDSLSEGVMICDGADRVVMVNEAYRRRYPGRTALIAEGRTFEDALRVRIAAGELPESAADEEAWIAARMRLHRSAEGGFERQLPDGTWVWITERRMRGGGTVTLHVDITALKQTEIALRLSEERSNLAQEAGGVGTWEYALDTKTLLWSREMYRARGLSPEEFRPDPASMAQFVHPEDYDKVTDWLRDLRHGLERSPIDERVTRADGAQRLFRLQGKAIADADGTVRRIVGSCYDITDRQRTEQQLAHAQKMEAIGNLTGGMAHDFNNVLSIVISNLELAELDLDHDTAPYERLQDALDAALRAADLTHRLLAFARRQALTVETLNLNEVMTNMQRLLSRVLGETIVSTLSLADDLWEVVSDRAQIEASVVNLAMNARDAMPRGGTLTIETRNRTLDAAYVEQHPAARMGDFAVITIVDTGTGMTPEVLSRIFEPFFTTKAATGGTGLGLSMVFGFITQSGGHAEVQSEPGVGTRISLFLPRATADTAPAPARTSALEAGRGETVLVVEDNALLRAVVARQVAVLGYRVLEASNAAEALALLERHPVDLLFTDIVMPGGMDGFGLAQEASARWPQLRVLLTSGFTPNAGAERGPALQAAWDMLRKPFRRDDLAEALRAALDRRAPVLDPRLQFGEV